MTKKIKKLPKKFELSKSEFLFMLYDKMQELIKAINALEMKK